jgi:hypothetical protein
MSCDTIKYKVLQSPETKNLTLQIYRPYGEKNEWVMMDHLNEITTLELKCLTEYLISLFKTKT